MRGFRNLYLKLGENMDTKVFDDSIIAVTPQLDQAKTELANDPTTIALKQYGDKGDLVQNLQKKIADTENKKAQFVSIHAQIDTKTQEIADLTKQANEIKASIV